MSHQLEFAATRNLVQDPRVRHGRRAPGCWLPAAWSGFEVDWNQHLASRSTGVRTFGSSDDRAARMRPAACHAVAIFRIQWTGI